MGIWVTLLLIVIAYTILQKSCGKCRHGHRPISIRHSKVSGLGIFATRDIPSGTIIERCPTLAVQQSSICPESGVCNYAFSSTHSPTRALVAWGLCSLFNHSNNNNAVFEAMKDDTITITTIKPIQKGEEIFVNYGPEYWNSRGIQPF